MNLNKTNLFVVVESTPDRVIFDSEYSIAELGEYRYSHIYMPGLTREYNGNLISGSIRFTHDYGPVFSYEKAINRINDKYWGSIVIPVGSCIGKDYGDNALEIDGLFIWQMVYVIPFREKVERYVKKVLKEYGSI